MGIDITKDEMKNRVLNYLDYLSEKDHQEIMYDAFCAEILTPPDLKFRLTPKSKKLRNPVTDIVDSYFICKYGWEGFIAE